MKKQPRNNTLTIICSIPESSRPFGPTWAFLNRRTKPLQSFPDRELKVPGLGEKEYEVLAASYYFSGGQIDNIAPNKDIQEVVQGKKCLMEDILVFCTDELPETNIPGLSYATGN